MSDCRFGVSPVNYPDPDPDQPYPFIVNVFVLNKHLSFVILKMMTDDDPLALALRSLCFHSVSQTLFAS